MDPWCEVRADGTAAILLLIIILTNAVINYITRRLSVNLGR